MQSDSPIASPEEDEFSRRPLALQIAREILSAPQSSSYVIGICGPWGSGKTSVLNLAIRQIDGDVTVLNFNPWLFSGTEDLVNRFLAELAATLGQTDRLRKIASSIAGYAGALSGVASLVPVVGHAASTVANSAAKAAGAVAAEPPLAKRRDALREAMASMDIRVVVVLDDLDRITDDELREVVRLVKLTGDLPNVTYVLAYDRDRVEQALGAAPYADPASTAARGRAFLEKIVQSTYDVPPLRDSELIAFLDRHLARTIDEYSDKMRRNPTWGNMLGLGIRPFLRTPRDVKRLANAVPAASALLGDEVNLVDIIGLQALRVFEPRAHSQLADVADLLVDDRFLVGDTEEQREEDRSSIDKLVALTTRPDATRQLLGQLFPRAETAIGGSVRAQAQYRDERAAHRVSIPAVFRAYLHATRDSDVIPATQVARIAQFLNAPNDLRLALADVQDAVLGDLLDRLVDHASEIEASSIEETGLVILETEHRLDDTSVIFFRRRPGRWIMVSLVGQLLLQIDDLSSRSRHVTAMFDAAPTLSIKHTILFAFGTFPERSGRDPDAEMLDRATTTRTEESLLTEVLDAAPASLAGEFAFRGLLSLATSSGTDAALNAIRDKARNDQFMIALLVAYTSITTGMGEEIDVETSTFEILFDELDQLLANDMLRNRVAALWANIRLDELDPITRHVLRLYAARLDIA